MHPRVLATLAMLVISLPVTAATQSEEPFLRPRVSRNQTRPAVNRPGGISVNLKQDFGPGPGNGGASSCQSDTACRTTQDYQCKAFTGLTCYSWPTADGLRRCSSC